MRPEDRNCFAPRNADGTARDVEAMKYPTRIRVISGGQSGSDRAGLVAAKAVGFDTGGVAPKGFLTETGADPSLASFGLTEAGTGYYPNRTRLNVLACDLCLWFGSPSSRGGLLTARLCKENGKPMVVVNPSNDPPSDIAARLKTAIAVTQKGTFTLMCAGNRESTNPGIGVRVEEYLFEVLTILKGAAWRG